jgi:hypothetical protein
VVVADDGSDQDTLGELRTFSAKFPWKFVRVDTAEFVAKTGIEKFHNNPCLTNNIAFRHSTGDLIFQQGNEVIAWGSAYDQLIADIPRACKDCTDETCSEGEAAEHFMVMSTTYDVPQQYLDLLDPYGQNLTPGIVNECRRWPLQSKAYRSDVTNYICLASRALWEKLNGYDERYFGGISAEDSDFVRRARCLPDFKQVISEGLSLHQFHGGKTCYYSPRPSVISEQRFDEGCQINRAIYDAWDNTYENRTPWQTGTFGVAEVISNT